MSNQKKNISKTQRILTIYHLLRACEEVSMQELRSHLRLKEFSDKTFSRDIALLKRAGITINFSGRRKAFVLVDGNGEESRCPPRRAPDYPEGRKERLYLEKIIRLTAIMDDIPYKDCDVWYRETFPEVSKRTMQRDFAVLSAIGYEIYYKRAWDNPYDKDDDDPPGHYYCE